MHTLHLTYQFVGCAMRTLHLTYQFLGCALRTLHLTENSHTQNYYRAQSVPRHIIKNKTAEISAPSSHLTAFLSSAKR